MARRSISVVPCARCKIRRIKCDKKRPVCGQCALAKTECPGSLTTKGSSIISLARKKKHSRNDDDDDTAHHHTLLATRSAQLQALKLLYERFSLHTRARHHVADIASSHFLANFVLVPQRTALASTLGYFEFVPDLLNLDHAPDRPPPPAHFQHAYDACALASLHNRFGPCHPELTQSVHATYHRALHATRLALEDPKLALQDHTLASVLLLGYFEQLTATAMSMASWSSHTRGSVELVRRRGSAQLKTKVGRDLFIAVRTRMIINSLRTGLDAPPEIDWWIPDEDGQGPGWHFHYLTSKTAEIKAEANFLFTPSPSNDDAADDSSDSNSRSAKALREMIRKCKAHEASIVQALDALPRALQRETVGWASPRDPKTDWADVEAFPGPVDAYRDVYVADLWNVMRMMRLLLGSIIIRCTALLVAPTDYRTTTEYKLVMKTSMSAIDHIIASVPFSLGHADAAVSNGTAPDDAVESKQQQQQYCLAGFIMLYPLMSLYVQDYLTNAQRDWVAGRLKYISNCMGIRFGSVLCQLKLRDPSFFVIRDGIMRNARRLQKNMILEQPPSQSPSPSSSSSPASASESQYASASPPSVKAIMLDAQLAAMRKQVAARKMTTFKDHDPGDWATAAWLSL